MCAPYTLDVSCDQAQLSVGCQQVICMLMCHVVCVFAHPTHLTCHAWRPKRSCARLFWRESLGHLLRNLYISVWHMLRYEYIYTHQDMYIHTHAHMHTCAHLYLLRHPRVQTVCVCFRVSLCVCIYTFEHIHTRKDTHIHTPLDTHIHTPLSAMAPAHEYIHKQKYAQIYTHLCLLWRSTHTHVKPCTHTHKYTHIHITHIHIPLTTATPSHKCIHTH